MKDGMALNTRTSEWYDDGYLAAGNGTSKKIFQPGNLKIFSAVPTPVAKQPPLQDTGSIA